MSISDTLLSWEALLRTVQTRPYVFVFLISFLTIGILNRGWRNTLIFLGLGFGIAYLSEFSSIRNGFPYGLYHYRYENLQGELLLWGVPLWDSLSYSFLAYASYEYAEWLMKGSVGGPGRGTPTDRQQAQFMGRCRQWGWAGDRTHCLCSAFLMTALDVVVDPLAVRGSRWFLGNIFYYPNGGAYFGVPLSNFAGWFLVALLIVGIYRILTRAGATRRVAPARYPLLGPLFYWGILCFNLGITVYLKEWTLLACGLLLHAGIILSASRLLTNRVSPGC